MKLGEKFKLQRLSIKRTKSSEPIDFDIIDADTGEHYATIWGTHPVNDINIECEHPTELVEYEDDETQGECPICGAYCDWHFEEEVVNEGHDEDGNYTCQVVKVRVPHEWHNQGVSGIIKDCLNYFKNIL